MNQNQVAKMLVELRKSVADLQVALAEAQGRIKALEEKRGPGRPPKVNHDVMVEYLKK